MGDLVKFTQLGSSQREGSVWHKVADSSPLVFAQANLAASALVRREYAAVEEEGIYGRIHNEK